MDRARQSGSSILAVACAMFLGACVHFYFTSDKEFSGTSGTSMSDQELATMFGGTTASCNCDDCEALNDVYFECFHTTDPPECDEDLTKCIKNILSTATCKPNQSDADGCDTDYAYPLASALTQEIYKHSAGYTCSVLGSTSWSVWHRLWHGCDTSAQHWCVDLPVEVACGTLGCPSSTYLYSNYQGAKRECGC